jgi:hypothetical protein
VPLLLPSLATFDLKAAPEKFSAFHNEALSLRPGVADAKKRAACREKEETAPRRQLLYWLVVARRL